MSLRYCHLTFCANRLRFNFFFPSGRGIYCEFVKHHKQSYLCELAGACIKTVSCCHRFTACVKVKFSHSETEVSRRLRVLVCQFEASHMNVIKCHLCIFKRQLKNRGHSIHGKQAFLVF